MQRRPRAHRRSGHQGEDDMGNSSRRLTRRTFVTASAASAGALATGVFAPAVRAARTLKLGYVSPRTGPLAAFAEADNFVTSNFQNAVKDLKIRNATWPVEVIVKDSQSNPSRAADVARELIVGNKVDLMLVASTRRPPIRWRRNARSR